MYHRLLVPVDGSDRCGKVIAESIALARQLHASITAFVAQPEAPDDAQDADAADPALDAPPPGGHACVEPMLSQFASEAARAGVAFERCSARDDARGRSVVAAAESSGCDMLVMVSVGRGAFGEFLYGSQTMAMLAESRLPLLVLH